MGHPSRNRSEIAHGCDDSLYFHRKIGTDLEHRPATGERSDHVAIPQLGVAPCGVEVTGVSLTRAISIKRNSPAAATVNLDNGPRQPPDLSD